MKNKSLREAFPVIVCAGLLVLSVLIVFSGHKQGDTNAAAAASATAAAPTRTATLQPTLTPAANR